MKVLTTITLHGSHKLLRADTIRSPAALPRTAIRGRAFLSEHADDNRFCYYKGGLAPQARNPPPDSRQSTKLRVCRRITRFALIRPTIRSPPLRGQQHRRLARLRRRLVRRQHVVPQLADEAR